MTWTSQAGRGGRSRGKGIAVYMSLIHFVIWASHVVLVVKHMPANGGDVRDTGLVSGSGRSPGGGHGSSLQSCCLEDPMDRGAWKAIVYRVAKTQT